VFGVNEVEYRSRARLPGRALTILLTLCIASGARAEEASSKALASREFRRGIALAKTNDLAQAADAFENAYRTHPHYAVLYNLGQAYVGLGKPVEAVRAFEKFLEDGGNAIDGARRADVERIVKRERTRIGWVELTLVPGDAEVFVDDRAMGSGSASSRLALAAGQHTIAVRKAGHATRLESLAVKGGETLRLSLSLAPDEPPHEPPHPLGQLVVACGQPAVAILVDGEPRGATPLSAPLLVSQGTRSVRLARPGYQTVQRVVAIREGAPARIDCDLRVELGATPPSRLKVTPSDPFARVSVDGAPFDGEPLPSGPHWVTVERDGYVRWHQLVSLEPGGSRAIAVMLEPTPERRAELAARSKAQDAWALGLGATGVALLGTAAGLFLWNDERYEDWQAEGASPSAPARAAELQRTDDVAAGLAILGGGSLLTAAVLWFTNDRVDPSPNQRPHARMQSKGALP